jgi:hypothetical protein
MSGRKNTLKKFKTIEDGDMSAASITSSVTNIEFLDNIGVQLNFSGGGSGTFQAQVSSDYEVADGGTRVINPGQWVPITLNYLSAGSIITSTNIPTSAGSPIYLDLNQLSAPNIRIVYTRIAGSGTLNAIITAKMV